MLSTRPVGFPTGRLTFLSPIYHLYFVPGGPGHKADSSRLVSVKLTIETF